ncbi:MAG: DUF4139 domain-containing protein [Rhodospirillales bacterium]|nr:DUF4139 domain-containing protein [Rhodospirillales bacterium]
MRISLLALAGAALMAATAAADETAVLPASRSGLAVTLYADGFGLVTDRRTVDLAKGANSLAFEGVSARMVPSSALLRVGDGVKVLERNFEFDLLSPQALLERSVGKTVRVIRTRPDTGEEMVETATVLAVGNGPVLKIGDRIEITVPGRLVFDTVPAGLRAQPTLLIEADSAVAGQAPLELTYLTEGLSWRADYAAELDAAGKTLSLGAWASLSNATGIAFSDADVQMIAGNVRRESERPLATFKGANMMAAAPAEDAMRREAVGDVHLYALPGKVTLANNQSKQVALLSAAAVPVARQYVRERWITEIPVRGGAAPATYRPAVTLKFANAREAGLGLPLPAGLVRVYERDSQGRIQFTGEQSIAHTAAGEEVTLNLGEATDIGIQYRQGAFTTDGLPERAFETEQQIALSNAKAEAVTVRLVERFQGAATIVTESKAHEDFSGSEATWTVGVPAGGKATLSYRVRVQRPR